MSKAAFEAFIAPARVRPAFWRMLLGLVLILLGWLIWTAAVMAAALGLEIGGGTPVPDAMELLGEQFTANNPRSIALMLLTFVGIWPSAALVVRWLHKRPFGTLLSPERKMRWAEVGKGLALAALLWGTSSLVALLLVGVPERSGLPLSLWLLWLVPLAVLVFLQSAGEELVFRGYLLQQLAVLSRSPMVWGFLPAFLFGIAHWDPSRGMTLNTVYVGATLVFGLIAAVLVWRTGGLGMAAGIHAGNNFGALGLTGLQGVATGSQLWAYQAEYKDLLITIDLCVMGAFLALLLSPACPRLLRARA